MICDFLMQRTGNLFKEPRNTILQQFVDHGNELIAEEMGFGTQVNQNNFKVAVEQFAGQIKAVEEEIANQVKT